MAKKTINGGKKILPPIAIQKPALKKTFEPLEILAQGQKVKLYEKKRVGHDILPPINVKKHEGSDFDDASDDEDNGIINQPKREILSSSEKHFLKIADYLEANAVSLNDLAEICESYYKEHGDVDEDIIEFWFANSSNDAHFKALPKEELMDKNAPIWKKFGNSSEYVRCELINKYVKYNAREISADQLVDILAINAADFPKQQRPIIDQWLSRSSVQRVSDLLEDEKLLSEFGDQARYVKIKSKNFVDLANKNKDERETYRVSKASAGRVSSSAAEESHSR